MEKKKLNWYADAKGLRAEEDVDGFLLVFTYRQEEYGVDLSWLGNFSDKYSKGAIDWQEYINDGSDRLRNVLPWYTSCNYDPHKEENREAVIADIQRLRDYGDVWDMGYLTVRVYKADIELGRASLGSIESDSEKHCQGYRDETAWELADEALVEARQMLAKKIKELQI